MRKCLSLAICLILLLLCGCTEQAETDFPGNGNFYYLRNELQFHSSEGHITSEKRAVSNMEDDLETLLNTYLAGPENEELLSPFPKNTSVKNITHKSSIFSIQLSNNFSELTGYDLTVACACLTLTIQEFVDAKLIQISAENSMLDGNKHISMNADSILLLDDIISGS